MDSRVVGPRKLLLLVQVQGNQGVRISRDLLASWFDTIRGWGWSDGMRRIVHVVQRMGHVVRSIQSDL